MVKKRRAHPKIQFQVVVCFGCGGLIGRNDRNFVSIFWNDGDVGRDEVVTPHRASTVRMCCKCRQEIRDAGWLYVELGNLAIRVVIDTTNEMSKTSAHGVLPCRAMRRVI